MSTLADRLALALKGPPEVSQADLARACGVRAPSVNDWLSGKTKRLEASNLLAAARALSVSPDWLASGKGAMRESAGSVRVSSQPAGQDLATMAAAVELARHWIEIQGLEGSVADHIPLLALAHQIALEDQASEAPGNVLDLTKKLAARLRTEAAHGDQRGKVEGAVEAGDSVRRSAARGRKGKAPPARDP